MRKKYLTLIEEQNTLLQKYNRVFGQAGLGKILLSLSLCGFLYLMFKTAFTLELALTAAVDFLVLAALWFYQNTLSRKIDYAKGLISICQSQIDRINGAWRDFPDTGAEFADPAHPYAADLDVVGKNSLFQFLNTTQTWHGRQAFVKDLLEADYSADALRQRQEAIAELSPALALAHDSQYLLSQIKAERNSTQITRSLAELPPLLANQAVKLLLTYGSWLTLAFITAVLLFQRQQLYYPAVLIAVTQLLAWTLGLPATRKFLSPLQHLPNRLGAYDGIVKLFAEHDFSSAKLNQIKAELASAAPAIRDLNRIESRLSVRNNGLVYFLLNVLLMWDYRCAYLLAQWQKNYAPVAERWFMAIGEYESLVCFSHLPNICDNTCLPSLTAQKNRCRAVALGHPLLPNASRINNDFNLEDQILIISGSNMSGKTTLLRTVGINLVLAKAGGFVCAQNMDFASLRLVTSMRVTDDLSGGVSTFYAELKRIGKMIKMAQKEPELLFLIDEIFKGTNSEDRLTGAATVLTKLDALGAIGLISTHDLELCRLADTRRRFVNFNFSESYRDHKIHFDYKIRPGKSTTTNAKYLMQMVGILEEHLFPSDVDTQQHADGHQISQHTAAAVTDHR